MRSNPPPPSAALQDHGLKVTLPRLRVLAMFESAPTRHHSAEDVFRVLLAEGHEVGLATVYRVLNQFVQAGVLTRTHLDGDRAVYELNDRDHHDHIVCVRCGRVVEFVDPQIERRQREIAAERGFELADHRLQLFGECAPPGCEVRTPD